MTEKEPKIPEKFEPRPKQEGYVYSEKVEEIALRASEMTEFQEAVKQAKGKIEAIKAVRELLAEHFPEIKEIPEAHGTGGILGHASNEFIIARNIVDLLYEK